MNKLADLHLHTMLSDGALSTRELFGKVKEAGLSVISITDHDNVQACEEAASLESEFGIEFINGVELSCFEEGKEYHLLGYAIDIDNPDLKKHLDQFRRFRFIRAELMHKKLTKLGFNFDFDLIIKKADQAPIARPHIADVLVDLGYVKSPKEAFQSFIGDGGVAYQAKAQFLVENAIKLINKCGGVAVLAHPANTVDQSTLYRMIKSGLDGIEVCHPSHNQQQQKFYHTIAGQYWLIETGGSDFHGKKEYEFSNLGKYTVPYSVVESIRYHSALR